MSAALPRRRRADGVPCCWAEGAGCPAALSRRLPKRGRLRASGLKAPCSAESGPCEGDGETEGECEGERLACSAMSATTDETPACDSR